MKAIIDFEEGLYRRLKIEDSEPEWFASLNEYAINASGKHDLAAMRASFALERKPRR